MIVLNLNNLASAIVEQLNNESRTLKVRMNLGGFAWIVDSNGVCVENGFSLIGNSAEVQRSELKRLANVLKITAVVI